MRIRNLVLKYSRPSFLLSILSSNRVLWKTIADIPWQQAAMDPIPLAVMSVLIGLSQTPLVSELMWLLLIFYLVYLLSRPIFRPVYRSISQERQFRLLFTGYSLGFLLLLPPFGASYPYSIFGVTISTYVPIGYFVGGIFLFAVYLGWTYDGKTSAPGPVSIAGIVAVISMVLTFFFWASSALYPLPEIFILAGSLYIVYTESGNGGYDIFESTLIQGYRPAIELAVSEYSAVAFTPIGTAFVGIVLSSTLYIRIESLLSRELFGNTVLADLLSGDWVGIAVELGVLVTIIYTLWFWLRLARRTPQFLVYLNVLSKDDLEASSHASTTPVSRLSGALIVPIAFLYYLQLLADGRPLGPGLLIGWLLFVTVLLHGMVRAWAGTPQLFDIEGELFITALSVQILGIAVSVTDLQNLLYVHLSNVDPTTEAMFIMIVGQFHWYVGPRQRYWNRVTLRWKKLYYIFGSYSIAWAWIANLLLPLQIGVYLELALLVYVSGLVMMYVVEKAFILWFMISTVRDSNPP